MTSFPEDPTLTLAAAKPCSYVCPLRRTALVLVDIQRDFVDPAGFGAVQCGSPAIFSGIRIAVAAAKAALAAARRLGLHVIHTREAYTPDLADLCAAKRDRFLSSSRGIGIGDTRPAGRLFVRDEHGTGTVDDLQPRPGEIILDKPGKSAFWNTDLHRKLMARGITHLLVCGLPAEGAVCQIVREASDRGFQCCVLSDCTGGFHPSLAASSLATLTVSSNFAPGFVAPSTDLIVAALSADYAPSPPWDERSLDIHTLSRLYAQRTTTPTDVIRKIYARIEAYERDNPHVWIYLRPLTDILEDATQLVHAYVDKELPPLYGLPFAVKDNFDVAGMPTTAGCAAFTYKATTTAPVVAALLAAGAILIGKTNMDQLATGLSGCRSAYGTPTSVFGKSTHVCGGSSSGSSVAVAAQLVSFALGTDTAGSGRVPAAFNGIVGYKPTRGTLSARGIVPACRSLDTASIFARSAADARQVWYAVDAYDADDFYATDPGSLPLVLADYRGLHEAGFNIGLPPRAVLEAACTPAFLSAFDTALGKLQAMGGQPVTLDEAVYKPFTTATELLYSGALVHERISCIGRDFLLENMDSLHPTTKKLFGDVMGRDTKPCEVFADRERQAEAARQVARLMSRQGGVGRRLDVPGGETIDVLVVPTVPCHPTVAEMEADPIGLNAKLGEFTHFGNVLDLCAISLNAGFVERGMPFGMSLVCARGLDGYLFDIATEFERAIEGRRSSKK